MKILYKNMPNMPNMNNQFQSKMYAYIFILYTRDECVLIKLYRNVLTYAFKFNFITAEQINRVQL